MLVAPTEPRVFDVLGKRSSLPEKYGADFAFPISGVGWAGVQRKEIKDFVASVYDGRLAKELGQMQGLARAVLCIEGKWQWTIEGDWVERGWKWTRQGHQSYLWSVQERGVWVCSSDGITGTVEVVKGFELWAKKNKHNGTLTRPSPRGVWGKPSTKDYAIWLLTSLPGVGPELAARIWERFGCAPLSLSCSVEELMEVRGMGKKKAEAIARCLAVN